jgi:hypothetical protein
MLYLTLTDQEQLFHYHVYLYDSYGRRLCWVRLRVNDEEPG